MNRLPATSLENESRGIPELRLHHVVIIATWRTLTLNKRITLFFFSGKEVISEYFFDGSQDFLFWRVCAKVTACCKLVSYVATGLTQ